MEIKHEDYEQYLKEEYFTVREAAELLEIGEEELWKLAHEHSIPTHNVAGVFLRFKKKDIEELKNKWRIDRDLFAEKEHFSPIKRIFQRATIAEKVGDFWYFNDFYIVCSILIGLLVYFIVSCQ